MSDTAISVVGLDKAFRVWKHPRDMLLEVVLGRTRHTQFQALSGVSFDVPRGSVVGIMGRNGAGKSTLLRIVAGTLDATGGHAVVNGRVSAILELGTGFHADYTGRENVFLGGMCLGLSRAEVAAKFDEIVDFAELREFIDQPFKTYSSGMQARLTFAVATSTDPDILIVDEALGVGDARFQLKSFDRIRKFRERGKSILLVSHNINQIVSICDHAILLERGRIHAQGDPNSIGNIYHEMLFGSQIASGRGGPSLAQTASDNDEAQGSDAQTSVPTADQVMANEDVLQIEREQRYGLRNVSIAQIAFLDVAGRSVKSLKSLETYRLRLQLKAKFASPPLDFGFLIRDSRGFELFGWDTANANCGLVPSLQDNECASPEIEFKCNLAAGSYFLSVALAHSDKTKEDMRFDALEFVVEPTPFLHTSSLVNMDVRLLASADLIKRDIKESN